MVLGRSFLARTRGMMMALRRSWGTKARDSKCHPLGEGGEVVARVDDGDGEEELLLEAEERCRRVL